jgi:hypothetical protein
MNLKAIVEDAYELFTREFPERLASEMVFERYATEELKLNKEDTPQFVIKAVDGSVEQASEDEYNRFYLWFYINYVVPQNNKTEENISEKKEDWRIAINLISIAIYQQVSYKPVQSYIENDQTHYEACEPENAELWSVYLTKFNKEDVCFANCKDEITAIQLTHNLKTLIDHWLEPSKDK